jgi:molecular chaperone DnaK (HSP70)
VHPGSEKVVVPVPLPLDHFRPCFPIAEDFRSPDRYCSRFFPGLTQRLRREFQIGMRNQPTSSRQIAAELVQRAIQEAESFAGRPIESLILSAPVTLNDDARNALTQAITLSKLPGELRSDVEAACAAFRQTELGDSEHTTVLILSAGYT